MTRRQLRGIGCSHSVATRVKQLAAADRVTLDTENAKAYRRKAIDVRATNMAKADHGTNTKRARWHLGYKTRPWLPPAGGTRATPKPVNQRSAA